MEAIGSRDESDVEVTVRSLNNQGDGVSEVEDASTSMKSEREKRRGGEGEVAIGKVHLTPLILPPCLGHRGAVRSGSGPLS